MTWNFFLFKHVWQEIYRESKEYITGCSKKRICFSKCANFGRLQIFKNDNFKLWKSWKCLQVLFICTIMPTKMSGRQRIPYRVFKKKEFFSNFANFCEIKISKFCLSFPELPKMRNDLASFYFDKYAQENIEKSKINNTGCSKKRFFFKLCKFW